ncbi:MAG: hypothetical protein IT349_20475 [Candidatus Eisenbacteria bacterium]|nr:hypothetical protein [Candidatus Eisenbacteria bacterium]
MRILIGVLAILCLMMCSPDTSNAVPTCAQITSNFCYPYPGCLRTVEFRGSCTTGDREWRCRWYAGESCNGGYSGWSPCSCPGGGGGCDCLLEGTPITMADGSQKAVEQIQEGNVVLSYDEAKDALVPSVVTKVHKPFETPYYYVINDELRVTETHPVLRHGRWTSAGELQVGDQLGQAGALGTAVKSIVRVDRPARVYNFQVSLATYLANGIIVHNKEDCEDFTQYCPSCEGGN